MKNNKILVTGGAGYIGSHVLRQLGAAGESVITLDNLASGFEAAVTAGELIIGDTGDAALLERLFDEHDIEPKQLRHGVPEDVEGDFGSNREHGLVDPLASKRRETFPHCLPFERRPLPRATDKNPGIQRKVVSVQLVSSGDWRDHLR